MDTKPSLPLTLLLFLILVLAASACTRPISQPAYQSTLQPGAYAATGTALAATMNAVSVNKAAPTEAAAPADAPAGEAPTEPPAPEPTQPPPPPVLKLPTAASGTTVKIFLIAVNDGGTHGTKIGCNDSVVPVTVEIEPTVGVLRAAINKLFEVKSQNYGDSGLYNALYQSDLSIQSLAVVNGVAVMHFSGSIVMGGECDGPRVKAQLEEVAKQFSTVSSVEIYINDKTLDDVISNKGT
jgi:hypothetical protein